MRYHAQWTAMRVTVKSELGNSFSRGAERRRSAKFDPASDLVESRGGNKETTKATKTVSRSLRKLASDADLRFALLKRNGLYRCPQAIPIEGELAKKFKTCE